MLDPLEGLPVFQIWRECRQRLEIPIWQQKKLTSEFFCFRLGRLKTLVLNNHFVRKVGCFIRAGHILNLVMHIFYVHMYVVLQL